MTRGEAKFKRSQLEAYSAALPDEIAATIPMYAEPWRENTTYVLGERVQHDRFLWKCLQAHTSQAGWEPGIAVSLWAKILPGQDETDVGEWEQPDSTNPYMKGDVVMHNGKMWVSDYDNNVWEPGVYGWTEVTA